MDSTNSNWYLKFLSCPDCRGHLLIGEKVIKCDACTYQKQMVSQIDLRPVSPTKDKITLARIQVELPSLRLENINTDIPRITYDGPSALRDSSGLLSEVARYIRSGACLLDLGCGPRDQAIPVRYLGYRYVGIDYSDPAADILGDAHAIPFISGIFDCVLSYAVLEHVHNPFVAIREIERVLKPGGIFVGTVSQGEPFHDSYFHHTAWGLISLIESTVSLRIERLWDSMDTLESLARMGRYPKIIRAMLKAIERFHNQIPCLAPRRMKWSRKQKRLDKIYRAGSICFVMQKPTKNTLT